MMKSEVGDEIPIFGVAMSPFSLPVMQLGFSAYLDLLDEDPEALGLLLAINEQFCIEWANAQLAAGATGIVYFDPISSPTMVPRDVYLKLGQPLAKRVIAKVQGPVATHFASGATLPILEDVFATGTVGVGVSANEDLAAVKDGCAGKATIISNLDGITMRRWTPEEAELRVKSAIATAAPGGGFILSDNHGEIPYQVEEGTLHAIADAVRKWGRFPIEH